MIEIKDIQTAVAKLLKKNDYSVVASEVKEGFTKPACFIEVMPVSVTIENQFNELITNSVEISYFPSIETKEELIKTAEDFKKIFLYSPLKVKDRYLSINEISFDADKSTLLAYFELEFLQEITQKATRIPKMKTLKESVVTGSHGTS
ncbi:MAG: hypothetical protein IJ285_02950 [Clostridia bacterium]|nr:hypothetical protein [Clostridia bacterium]